MTIRNSFLAGTMALATAFGAVAPGAQAAPIQPVPLAAQPFGEIVPVQALTPRQRQLRNQRQRLRQLYNQRVRRDRAFQQGVQRGRAQRRDRRDRRNRRGKVAAGIVGGLIVGGLIADATRRSRAAPRPYAPPVHTRGYSARHHDYCYARYRSYRASDGTFQPYHGGRRRCNSPYDGI